MNIEENEIFKELQSCLELLQTGNLNDPLPNLLEMASITSNVIIDLPLKYSQSTYKNYISVLNDLYTIFPLVFTSIAIKSDLKYNIRNKVLLNLAKISIEQASDGLIKLNSYSFTPLVFHLQLILRFIKISNYPYNHRHFNNFGEFYKFVRMNSDSHQFAKKTELVSNDWISQQIGANYSQGELIDWIDRLYDQYKITLISPQCFHLVFRSFEHESINIANTAFDYYMEFRECNYSWSKSINEFLRQNYPFTQEFATRISSQLLAS